MHYKLRRRLSTTILGTFLIIGVSSMAVALTLQEKTDIVLQACLGSGKQQKIDGKVEANGSITLSGPALTGKGDLALTQEEWSGLIGGISKEMTQLQAQQADKVRDCLAPARKRIIESLFQ